MAKKKIQEQEQELELIMQMNREMVEEQENTQENDSADSDVNAAAALPDEEELDENKKKNDDGNKSSQSKLTEEEKKKLEEEEEKKKKEEEKNKAAKKVVKNIGKNKLSSMNEIELAQYLLKLCYDPASLVTGEPGFENIDAVVRSFYQRFGQMDKTAQQYVENRFQFEVQRMSTSQQMVITNSAVKNALYDREAQNPTLLRDTVSFVTDEAIGNYDSTSTDFTSLHTIDALISMGYKHGKYETRLPNGDVVTVSSHSAGTVKLSSGKTTNVVASTIKTLERTITAHGVEAEDGTVVTVATGEQDTKGLSEKVTKVTETFKTIQSRDAERKSKLLVFDPKKLKEAGYESEEDFNKYLNSLPAHERNDFLAKGDFMLERPAAPELTPERKRELKAIERAESREKRQVTTEMFSNDTITVSEAAFGGKVKGDQTFTTAQIMSYYEEYVKNGGQMPAEHRNEGIETIISTINASNELGGKLTLEARKYARKVLPPELLSSFNNGRISSFDVKNPTLMDHFMSVLKGTQAVVESGVEHPELMETIQGFTSHMTSQFSTMVEANLAKDGQVAENVLNAYQNRARENSTKMSEMSETKKTNFTKTTTAGTEQTSIPPLQHTELTTESVARINQGANDAVTELMKRLEMDKARLNEQIASAYKTSSQAADKALNDVGRTDFRV